MILRVLVVGILLFAGSLRAAPVASDSFDYQTDDFIGMTGNSDEWGGAWEAANVTDNGLLDGAITVSSPWAFSSAGKQAWCTGDDRVERSLNTTLGENGTTIWMSVHLKYTDSNNTEEFVVFHTMQSGDRGVLLGTTRAVGGLSSSNNKFELANSPNGTVATVADRDSLGHFAVFRFDFGTNDNDTVTVFWDPDSSTDFNGSGSAQITGFDASFEGIAASAANSAILNFDEIRIGTSWEDVCSDAPGFSESSFMFVNTGDAEALTLNFENSSTSGILELDQLSLVGDDAGYFTISNYPPTVSPSSAGSIELTFDPTLADGGVRPYAVALQVESDSEPFSSTLTVYVNQPDNLEEYTSWLTQYNLTIYSGGGQSKDVDSDGIPNSEEFWLGSSPIDDLDPDSDPMHDWLPRPEKMHVLAICGHADDEGIFFGGLLPYLSQVKRLNTLLLCTVDQSDQYMDGCNYTREEGMRWAAWEYGLRYQPIFPRFLNHPNLPRDVIGSAWDAWDGNLSDGQVDKDGNGIPDGRDAGARYIAKAIRQYKPDVVAVHDLDGEYGHGAHKASAWATVDAYALAADESVDIDGLAPWQVKKLYIHQSNTTTNPFGTTGVTFQNYLFHDHWNEVTIDTTGNLTPDSTPLDVGNDGLDVHAPGVAVKYDATSVYTNAGEYNNPSVGHIYDSEYWGLYASTVGSDTTIGSFSIEGSNGTLNFSNWARGDFFENLTDSIDADGDGIVDEWEKLHFPITGDADPDGDPDGDGFNNLYEFTVGLDPNVEDIVEQEEDLLRHYAFDGDFTDSSGNDQHATVNANVTFPDPAEKKFGTNSAYFPGSEYISVPRKSFSDGESWTISFWLKRDNADQAWNFVLGDTLEAAGNQYIGVDVNGQVRWRGVSFADGFITTGAVDNDAWHNYTVVSDGVNVTIYVDKVQKGTKDVIDTSFEFAHIGSGYHVTSPEHMVKGHIDEVWVFNKALDATERASLYDSNVLAAFEANDTTVEIVASDPTVEIDLTTLVSGGSGSYTFSSPVESAVFAGSLVEAGSYSSNGLLTYTRVAGQGGSYSFTYSVDDGSGLQTGTVTLNIAGLIAHYKMDEEDKSSGQSMQAEVTGTTGTYKGTSGATNITGYKGSAAKFGGDSYALAENITDLHSREFTVSCWANLNSSSTVEYILGTRSDVNSGWGLYYYQGTTLRVAYYTAGGGSWVQADRTISVEDRDTWSHYALTCTGTQLQLYVNGVKNGNTISMSSYEPGEKGLGIGAMADGRYDITDKSIDEVKVFNYTLTESELADLYTSTTGATVVNETAPGLVFSLTTEATGEVEVSEIGTNATRVGNIWTVTGSAGAGTSSSVRFSKTALGITESNNFKLLKWNSGTRAGWEIDPSSDNMTENGDDILFTGVDFEDTKYSLGAPASVLTPAIGLDLVQDGTLVTWTIESQIGVDMYIVTDAAGKEYEVEAKDGQTEYSVTVENEGEVTLTVVDGDYSQTFLPADGSKVKIVYELIEGWNLIAIAGDNAEVAELGVLWHWNGDSYEMIEAPKAGQAVWVHSASDSQVIVEADKVQQAELELNAGWNMVGPTENMEVPVEAHTVYGWTDEYQSIANDGTLLMGVGYWIFCDK